MDYNENYYNEDRRVGSQCFFDDMDVYIGANADLKTFLFTPGELEVDYGRSTGGGMLDLHVVDNPVATLTLEFYVGGPSYEATQTNISGLFLAGRHCVIRREGDIFEYEAVLTERQVEDTEVEPYYLVTCVFRAIRRKPLVARTLEGNAVIYNDGNVSSGVRLSFVSDADQDAVQLMGMSVLNVKKGVTYVIDGLKGRVTADGINYFAHTTLIDFPKIEPGKNEIQLPENISVTLEYYPVFQ